MFTLEVATLGFISDFRLFQNRNLKNNLSDQILSVKLPYLNCMRYIAKETMNCRTGTLLCRGYYEQCRLSIRAFGSIVFISAYLIRKTSSEQVCFQVSSKSLRTNRQISESNRQLIPTFRTSHSSSANTEIRKIGRGQTFQTLEHKQTDLVRNTLGVTVASASQ